MRVAILSMLIAAASSFAAGQTSTTNKAFVHSANVTASAPCRGEDLTVRHVTEDAAMGGHNTIDYAFKNNSSAPCTLKGYPRFELLNSDGRVRRGGRAIDSQQLPGDEAKQPPQLVTFEPGKEAGFRVYYNNGGAGYMGKPCPVSRKVRITAPGTTRRFVRREDITSCRTVEVSAVRSSVP